MKTTIRRSMGKDLIATSYAKLECGRELKVTTMKGSRGLYTSCQAVKIEPDRGTGFTGESFMMFGDYGKTMMHHTEVKRVTEKSLADSHEKGIANVQQFIDEANVFYANKVEKKPVVLASSERF